MALWFCRTPVENRPPRRSCHLDFEPQDLDSAIAAELLSNLLSSPYFTPGGQQDSSPGTVSVDKDRFQANLDVQQFRPEEISVKVTGDNTVTVEGKHEEKRDEHGFISRQFVRRYVLPEGHDINKVESKLSSDGVLTISAPKIDSQPEGHRSIPITRTGQPSKAIAKNKEKKDEPEEKVEEKKNI